MQGLINVVITKVNLNLIYMVTYHVVSQTSVNVLNKFPCKGASKQRLFFHTRPFKSLYISPVYTTTFLARYPFEFGPGA